MKLKSMTGFGRCECSSEHNRINVEVKSVNARFLDLSIKMPKKFNPLEAEIRQLVRKYIERGKVDLYISYDDFSEAGKSLRYNAQIAQEYMQYFRRMSEVFELPMDIKLSQLARMPEVLVLDEQPQDDEKLWAALKPALGRALESFVEARALEGEKLGQDLLGKLSEMEALVARIEQRAPEIMGAYQKKLEAKIADMLGNSMVDESRIAMEVTVFADKVSTDEEMVRLGSHIRGMRTRLEAGGSVGRELDFIAQEMNREANTTLSKANDLIVAEDAIALKTTIEKIREQIQNLE